MAALAWPQLARRRRHAQAVGAAVLRTYASVLFARSLPVGALLVAATATAPRGFLGGLAAALLALLSARGLGVERESVFDGSYAVSAVLLGLGIGQWFGVGRVGLGLLCVFVPLSVLLSAALRSLLGAARLPVLSLAFLGTFHLLLGLSTAAGLPYVHADAAGPSPLSTILPGGLLLLLRSVGALFFIPRADAGLLVLIALAVHSRIATVLATLALLGCLGLRTIIPVLQDDGLFHSLAYNAAFTAVALGGVWFVPSPSSFVLALVGVVLCALATLGLVGPLARLGLPLLVVPFNGTVLVALLALRQRALDQRPKSVDFTAGTPEQNLAYFRTRRERFASLHPVRFGLPVRGAWTCTQGIDGPLTHKGVWRYAFDFEVLGPDGQPHVETQAPAQLSDYRAYRLPVLATAAGTVIKVVSDVPDNPIGAVNVEKNWGNFVVLQHAPGLYSTVAHLAHGSIKVTVGQVVGAAEVLGLCGNSGRSPQPHVHFQLQSGPQPGDQTVPCRFSDVVIVADEPREPAVADHGRDAALAAPRVAAALAPQAGQIVRSLEPTLERGAFFHFPHGMVWPLQAGSGARVEHVVSELDLYGQRLLRSQEYGACLYYTVEGGFFTAYDLVGAPESALHLLRAALSRVPLEPTESLRWTDVLPARMFRGRLLGALFGVAMDMAAPFLQSDSLEVEYTARRSGAALLIIGESRRRDRRGQPLLQTLAELHRGIGPVRLRVSVRGHAIAVEQPAGAITEPQILRAA